MQNALSAPHIYELSKWLTPGMHTISIRIDNRIKDIDPGKAASSITDNTQTNWNGMIGKMILINHPAVYISDVQLYPDVDKKIVKAVVTVSNLTNKEMEYELSLMVFAKYVTNGIKPLTKRIKLNKDTTVIEWEYPMGDRFSLWDEFNPNVYTLNATLKGDLGIDTKATDFGMRKFEIKGTQFVMNGRTIFLRGTLECAIFPKTGYPSVSEKDWERIYRKCREYGLNHIRFHSWCPPEAAFIAADKMGIYLSNRKFSLGFSWRWKSHRQICL
jgi:beta-galactosidase/beta-glucuronidase